MFYILITIEEKNNCKGTSVTHCLKMDLLNEFFCQDNTSIQCWEIIFSFLNSTNQQQQIINHWDKIKQFDELSKSEERYELMFKLLPIYKPIFNCIKSNEIYGNDLFSDLNVTSLKTFLIKQFFDTTTQQEAPFFLLKNRDFKLKILDYTRQLLGNFVLPILQHRQNLNPSKENETYIHLCLQKSKIVKNSHILDYNDFSNDVIAKIHLLDYIFMPYQKYKIKLIQHKLNLLKTFDLYKIFEHLFVNNEWCKFKEMFAINEIFKLFETHIIENYNLYFIPFENKFKSSYYDTFENLIHHMQNINEMKTIRLFFNFIEKFNFKNNIYESVNKKIIFSSWSDVSEIIQVIKLLSPIFQQKEICFSILAEQVFNHSKNPIHDLLQNDCDLTSFNHLINFNQISYYFSSPEFEMRNFIKLLNISKHQRNCLKILKTVETIDLVKYLKNYPELADICVDTLYIYLFRQHCIDLFTKYQEYLDADFFNCISSTNLIHFMYDDEIINAIMKELEKSKDFVVKFTNSTLMLNEKFKIILNSLNDKQREMIYESEHYLDALKEFFKISIEQLIQNQDIKVFYKKLSLYSKTYKIINEVITNHFQTKIPELESLIGNSWKYSNKLINFFSPLSTKTCSICYDSFDNYIQLHCDHCFCTKCINDWVKIYFNKTCPYCRDVIGDSIEFFQYK